MSIEALNNAVQRLIAATEALGAIGADMRLRQEQLHVDRRVNDALRQVISAVDPGLFDGVPADQEAIILNMIRSAFRHAADLLDNPSRSPGWSFADTAMIQSQGQQSRRAVAAIEGFAATKPDFQHTLRNPGAFLDVGCGAGWLSIEAAQCWPALRTVGIDPWPAALNLARSNIAAAGLSGRIELREQRIEELQDCNEFTLLWLPGPFLPPDIVPKALERAHTALRPGGWLVFSLFGATPDALGVALAALRTVRYGGHSWRPEEIDGRLQEIGLADIESSTSTNPVAFIVGRKI